MRLFSLKIPGENMKATEYFLETAPQSWHGQRQLHAAGCTLMPAKELVKPIGRFARAMLAMQQARKIHRKTCSCQYCCKA